MYLDFGTQLNPIILVVLQGHDPTCNTVQLRIYNRTCPASHDPFSLH